MLELGAGFHPDFTGRENVYMNAAIQGLSRREVDARMEEIVAFSELEDFIDKPVRTYSSGMYMRLGFAVASHVNSDVLLLDEVLAVGDEAFQRKCFGRIFEYRRGGGTVVFVSHDAEAVERVCDRAILLEHGELVAEGRPGDVLATYRRALVRERTPGGRGDPRPAEASDEWGTRTVAITAVRTARPGRRDRPLRERRAARRSRSTSWPASGSRRPTSASRSARSTGPSATGPTPAATPTPVESVEGRGTAAFAIDRLPLHEGRFLLTVAVTSADESEVYHWIDRRFELSVFARTGGVGLVRFDGRWSVVRGAERRPDEDHGRWLSRPSSTSRRWSTTCASGSPAPRREGLYADDLSGPGAARRRRPRRACASGPSSPTRPSRWSASR